MLFLVTKRKKKRPLQKYIGVVVNYNYTEASNQSFFAFFNKTPTFSSQSGIHNRLYTYCVNSGQVDTISSIQHSLFEIILFVC